MMAGRIEIARLIDERPVSMIQWRVVALCALVAIFDGFDTQAIAFAAPSIAAEWHVDVASFGPVFAAGLLGLTLAALGLGALGDRIGRKRIILVSLLIMGVFSLLAARAESMTELAIMRFCVGIGLGGAMPSIIALTAEYAPARLRSTLVTSMFIGFPLGAVIGGAVSARLIGTFGWEAVFVAGGLLPLALAPLIAWALPESVRFLAPTGRHAAKALAIAIRIAPDLPAGFEIARPVNIMTRARGGSIAQLFASGRAATTLTLWAIFFCNLLVMYLLINWLPIVLTTAGMPQTQAILGTVLLNLGGAIGGFVIARSMDRRGGHGALRAAYLGATVFIAAIGFAMDDVRIAMMLIFLAGFCLIGAQFGMNALAAAYYETEIRSTGVGWALGIGRIGSIIGPMVGGGLIGVGADVRTVMLTAAVPTLACLAGMLVLTMLGRRHSGSRSLQTAGGH
jgi:AAHS family 4-hydroxybenzoate transporter-like MFS transporter